MTDSTETVGFTPEEQAYFESGGETEIPAEQPQPEEQPAPTPEEGQQPEAAQPERDDKGRFVPHQALHAEREEHKKTKAELDAIRQQQAVLNDRWQTILSLKEQEKQPDEPAPPPDPSVDIFAYSKWQAGELAKLNKSIADDKAQAQQRDQIERQEAEIWNDWTSDAQAYGAENPEFTAAVQWLSETRTNQLKAFAPINPAFANPQAINQQIDAELRSIIIGARESNQSPAKVVHDLAVSWGFKPQQPTPDAPPALPGQLQAVAKAQEASKTVGQGGGRSGGDEHTPESIAAMSPDEFSRWYSEPKNARLFEKMMGA